MDTEKPANREEELFSVALSLPAAERSEYVRLACRGDRDLQRRVLSLLDKVEAAERFSESEPIVAAELAHYRRAHIDGSPGDQIGGYRLLQEIGEGGCAVVYLAEQTMPVRREVAIKIIKLGMDTKAVIARFAAERQALAIMDHPNIARVFDAGATSAGRPYFVMELVRGIRITEYCDQAWLSITERIGLVMQLCRAIQHAHHKGIIHRDIKPSNVMVTLQDGAPTAKVIDFGIAKATQGRLTDETLYTAIEQFIGTPAYVSPEQTEAGGLGVGTRSDIYSLGVLFYELLTGYTPFNAEDLQQTSLERMKQRIREEDPPPPSRRLRALAPDLVKNVAMLRQTSATRLIKCLEGDLDSIVMRCLEKDPERRYQTCYDVEVDLQRLLRGERVSARPPGVIYTFSRFARRRRTLLATSASIVAVLIAATAGTSWLAVRATRAEASAQAEAAVRQEVIEFLRNDLLAQAAPSNEPDRDIRLRIVLDRAASRIGQRFVGQPLVEASIRDTLATTYASLGEYAAAEQQLRSALTIREQRLGQDHLMTLRVMSDLVTTLRALGKYSEAESLATQTLARQQRVLGAEHPDTLQVMSHLATLYAEQGRNDIAATLQGKTLAVRKRVLGAEHPDTLRTMSSLGAIYENLGRLADAEALQEETLALKQRVLGPEHPDTLEAMNDLAVTYQREDKLPEAARLQAQTLDIVRRVLGPEHPDTLAAMNNLGIIYRSEGNLAQAEAMYTQTLQTVSRVIGPEHPDALGLMNNLAVTYAERGKTEQAAALQLRALDIAQRVLGKEHPNTLVLTGNLAKTYRQAGKLAEAKALLTKTFGLMQRVMGAEHPRTLECGSELGKVLLARREFAEAEPLLRAALVSQGKSSAPQWRILAVQSELGAALTGLRRYDEAEQLLVDAYVGLRTGTTTPARDKEARETAARVRDLYAAWGKPEQEHEWRRKIAEHVRLSAGPIG